MWQTNSAHAPNLSKEHADNVIRAPQITTSQCWTWSKKKKRIWKQPLKSSRFTAFHTTRFGFEVSSWGGQFWNVLTGGLAMFSEEQIHRNMSVMEHFDHCAGGDWRHGDFSSLSVFCQILLFVHPTTPVIAFNLLMLLCSFCLISDCSPISCFKRSAGGRAN